MGGGGGNPRLKIPSEARGRGGGSKYLVNREPKRYFATTDFMDVGHTQKAWGVCPTVLPHACAPIGCTPRVSWHVFFLSLSKPRNNDHRFFFL